MNAKVNLWSDEGAELYAQRNVESVFGQGQSVVPPISPLRPRQGKHRIRAHSYGP